MPRWWLPGWAIVLLFVLSGCAGRTREGGDTAMMFPVLRMDVVRIPLHRGEPDVLDRDDPVERFVPVAFNPGSGARW